MKDGFIQAFRKGNAITRLSAIILGLGNLAGKQIIKGILYLAIEVSFICFMIFKGINLGDSRRKTDTYPLGYA